MADLELKNERKSLLKESIWQKSISWKPCNIISEKLADMFKL